ncbi:hypothetical protein GXW71_22760 [Roseomonas hellenica]|uniref:DUF883 domain-containing protein n=1 Tax=Plastoroseomonas hellenica TaxID=2687306 RepID=A0ABS5F3U4_9PROT|nr:hypothetical protein [Plastoroseomonas hellenica]MBR0667198.1 hypothetical protein [Plastoroseomonas hellenica]
MADTPSADDARKDLEKQIADLKKEVAALSKQFSARGERLYDDLRDSTEDGYEAVAGRARSAAKHIREQAQAVSGAMRENPGTTATVLSSAGLVGFLVGLFVGQLLSDNHRR